MASTSSFAISPLTILGASNPTIQATVCTLANTEYSYTLPAGTGCFFIQVRFGNGAINFAYAPGAPATLDSIYVGPGQFFARSDILNTATYTLYFQSPIAGTIVVIESWKTS